ncbi:hypothetical protein A4A49_40901 [Nicotiana attenuata]|uniref:PB1-like domain-containing protein n=1 Tax=Nicotiana attenuata TaxID=49451 RepID=A0A1J6KBZ8_NICAT|nr:hypothetical protein A4A49_40901 [Nicotiana attenuata]
MEIGGIFASEVGPLYVRGRVEHVTNVDCDHLSIPELVDYAKNFGIKKLGKTYIMSAKGGSLVELTKERDLMDLAMLLNNGDTIDIFVSSDSQFEEVHAIEGSQISHVGEPFNASSSTQQDNRESIVLCGPPLNTTAANPDLGLPTPLNTTQEDDLSIDWISSSEEEESAAATDDVVDIAANSQQVEPPGEEEEIGLPTPLNTTQEEDSPIDWTSSSEEEESAAAADSQQVEPAGEEEEEIASGDESERSFDYGSDVHEELRVVKEDLKKYRQKNMRKLRKEKTDGFLGEVGVDEESSNPKVLPPPVQNIPGRPRKNRRKEVGEIKGAGKLSKKGITMTCSICKASTHNMRSFPTRPTSNQETTNCSQQSTTKTSQKRGRKEPTSKASTSTGGKSGGARSHYKRPRLQGHGVFVAQSSFTSINHGLPTARKVYTGPLIDSTHVTGDIGYKPSKGLKWKGKEAVTQRQLQVQAAMARIKTRSQSGEIKQDLRLWENLPPRSPLEFLYCLDVVFDILDFFFC